MKIKYYQESDVLLFRFKDGIPADSIDLKEGVILHLNHDGAPLELEILDASAFVSVAGLTHPAMARRLVWGQFCGVGKNAAFGLGFYHIPEIWPSAWEQVQS